MKNKNHRVFPRNAVDLARIKAEYEYIGRDVDVRDGELIVLCLPRKVKPIKTEKTDTKGKTDKPARREQRSKVLKES